jgi:hypothetical protein
VSELAREKVTDEFDIHKETAKLNAYFMQSCDAALPGSSLPTTAPRAKSQ